MPKYTTFLYSHGVILDAVDLCLNFHGLTQGGKQLWKKRKTLSTIIIKNNEKGNVDSLKGPVFFFFIAS